MIFRGGGRSLAAAGLLLLVFAGACLAGGRDILLEIVSNCVDPTAADYCSRCRWPRADAACGQGNACRKTTEVWNLDDRFAAIRDVKMCGCPAGFVHGLALPRAPVTGVEDPRRPDAIWQFAWDTGVRRIEATALALAVNPAGGRSQDQLHVHLLRLRPGVDAALGDNLAGTVGDLAQVWAVAAAGAARRGLTDYGVLVRRPSGDLFQVVVTAGSPETAFTDWQCR